MAKKVTYWLFFLTLFSLPFANLPWFSIAGNRVQITEPLFVASSIAFALLVLISKKRLRPGSFYFMLTAYIAAQALSAVFSVDPETSAVKLAGIAYLAALAALSFNLTRSENALRAAAFAFIAAAFVASAYSIFVLVGFYVDRSSPLVAFGLSHYGTLPVGNYPRIQSLFANPNMFCHYLGITWVLLLLAFERRWIGNVVAVSCGAAILLAAALTLSPGIGGIALAAGLWIFFKADRELRTLRIAALAVSVLVAVLFVAATTVKVGPDFRPAEGSSARVLTWRSAAATFVADPITGRGVGTHAADVRYEAQHLTDAHDMYLNVLGESGIPAAFALVLMGVWILVRLRKPSPEPGRQTISRAMWIAFFTAFFYQGIAGSFEDARHLWVLAGMAAGVAASDFGKSADG